MKILKEFRHRTHVASCLASVLGYFHRENPMKCVKCQNSMELIMNARQGDASARKKIGSILLL